MVPPSGLGTELSNSVSALSASRSLLSAVSNIESLPTNAINLINELQKLTEVLGHLSEMIGTASYIEFSRLDSLLSLCGLACKEFEQELQNHLLSSNDGVMNPRDWVKLRCMGHNMNDLKELLSGYTVTIRITLADAGFRCLPVIPTEIFEAHEDLIQTAKVDLGMYLETLNERREQMPDPTSPEVQQLNEWQLSVENCLEICSQSADRIDEIGSKRKDDSSTPRSHDPTHHPNSQRSANISTISNYSTGDAVQFMFSADRSVLNGSNRGFGWRTRQAGGHFSDATGQQFSKDFASMSIRSTGNEASGLNHWSSAVVNDNPSDPMLLSNDAITPTWCYNIRGFTLQRAWGLGLLLTMIGVSAGRGFSIL